MVLTDIQPGTKISLEMQIGDTSYELPTTVVSIKQGYIIIDALAYNGVPIDLGGKKGIVFGIYAIDPASEGRVAWKNVMLETIQYTNNGVTSSYYRVRTNSFAAMSVTSDRRASGRVIIDKPGFIIFDSSERSNPVTIHDVSEHGVSFITMNDFDMESNAFYIAFNDDVNERPFSHRIRAIQVRSVNQGLQTLYGCNIPSPSRDYLTYIFLKKLGHKMDMMKAELEAKEKARAAAEAAASKTSSMGLYNKNT